jgi:collagen type VII alpha
MKHRILPGNKESAEIRDLEGGVSYSVRVTALVGDREGAPVSIVITTRRRVFGLEEVLE